MDQPPGTIGTGAQLPYGTNLYQNQVTRNPNPESFRGIQSTGGQFAYHQQQIYQEIERTNDFKNHSLPLARIKKIMKADEDVKMISAEAPVVFSRACEMFILELTSCSWNHTEENKRRTLQRSDIAAAITRTDIFDFLVDIVPRDDPRDEVLPRGTMPVGEPADALPYYMTPQHGTPPGMMVDPAMYAQQSYPYMAQPMWPPGPDQQHPSSDH